ncbi:MAG: hypothetical protein QG608_3886, partial [Actinomycetota bacterium]|nr:hypothetical protein [Actinomycetota bacterium]
MLRSRRAAIGVGVVFALVGCGAWARFLLTQDLDHADRWSSVVSAWVGLAGLVLSV